MIDLFAEFAIAAGRVERRHFDWFTRQGVPREFLWRGPARFGVAEIVPSNDGTFQPIDGGQRAIVMPAIPLAAPWEWDESDDIEDLADLIAWRPEEPGRFWFRTGMVPILNPAAIERACYLPPLRIYSSPLSWLRADGEGAVILDPEADLRFWLGDVRQIAAETIELGREIEHRMREPKSKVPTILVPRRRAA